MWCSTRGVQPFRATPGVAPVQSSSAWRDTCCGDPFEAGLPLGGDGSGIGEHEVDGWSVENQLVDPDLGERPHILIEGVERGERVGNRMQGPDRSLD